MVERTKRLIRLLKDFVAHLRADRPALPEQEPAPPSFRATAEWADDNHDSIIRVKLKKVHGTWQGAVRLEAGWSASPIGPLDSVLRSVAFTILHDEVLTGQEASVTAILAYSPVRVEVVGGIELTRPELLMLRDAVGTGHDLDISHIQLRDVDLSKDTMQSDILARSSRVKPRWISSRNSGFDLARSCMKHVVLWDVNLTGADLSGVELQDSRLTKVKLPQSNMFGANLNGAMLISTDFQGADLRDASLCQAYIDRADFRGAVLRSSKWREVRLHSANLRATGLQQAELQGVDLFVLEPGSLEGACLYGARLNQTLLHRHHFGKAVGEELRAQETGLAGDYEMASNVYLNLKNNFLSIGRYADASWAYQRERAMEREALIRSWHRRDLRSWANLWHWLANSLSHWVTGYGERPWLTVRASIGLVVAFALTFLYLDSHFPSCITGETADQHLSLGDALLLSSATFLSAGLDTIRPACRCAELLSTVESGLGIAFLALLAFTVGNRISRS